MLKSSVNKFLKGLNQIIMNNAKHPYEYLQGNLNITGKNIRVYRNQKRISAQ